MLSNILFAYQAIIVLCFNGCRYAQYGDVSSKVDVYAFGVVLYELISAKEAIFKTGPLGTETLGLVGLVSLLIRLIYLNYIRFISKINHNHNHLILH